MASNLSDSENKAIDYTAFESEEEDSDPEAFMGDAAKQLCKVLQSTLDMDRSKLPLPYAYSSLLPPGRLSGLSIEGLGSIKLPLSETDAKRIVAFASRARFAQDKQTIADKEVQNTWGIDAARVNFENRKWHDYVQDLAVKTVCCELGLTNYDTPPRCELSKLLVSETGSGFLLHRDIQKVDGMFATMIIILPSRYTGGEIHLTHASETRIVDFSSAKTAVIAYYTDVLNEMKPITSGYRLALSYNIVHTSRNVPLPTVSSADVLAARLRRVLWNWTQSCKDPKVPDCVAYLLKEQHSEADFGRGVSLLKGEDSQRIAFIRAAAEGLDFVILLAKLKYQVTENDRGYSGCCPCIIVDKKVTLSNWVDLDGHVLLDNIKSIKMKRCSFLSKSALRGVRPDGEEVWECGSGDGEENDEEEDDDNFGLESSKSFWYYRSVFVLVPSDKLPQILIRNGAMEAVLKQLKESLSENAPTEKDKFLANLIISNLRRHYSTPLASTLQTMLDCAYKWKDVGMWKDLMEGFEADIGIWRENGLVRAFRVFEFKQIRQTIEKILRTKHQSEKFAFIDAIRQAASESNDKDIIQRWCSAQVAPAVGRQAGTTAAGKKRKRS